MIGDGTRSELDVSDGMKHNSWSNVTLQDKHQSQTTIKN